MNPAEERAPNATRVIIVSLWLVVLTQKFALPGNIEVVLPIMMAVVAYMFLRGMSRLSLTHAMIFTGLAGLILVQQVLIFGGDFSYLAFMLMVGIYSAFMFVTPVSRPDYDRILRGFQVIAAFIALMVYLQWACQFLIGWFPHLELVAPQSLMYQNYNYVSPIQWGSSLMRPNGIFMLEPSHASQLIAMGAVFEAALFRRTRYLLILLPGIFVIFAGTGLLLAICCLPFILAQLNWRYLVRLGAVVAVVVAFAGALGMFDYLGTRAQEFDQEGTSGHGRFIGTYTMMLSTLDGIDGGLVTGIGQGNDTEVIAHRGNTVVFNAYSKAVLELGLITGTLFLVAFLAAVMRSGAPVVVIAALLIQYNFLNGSLLVPFHVALCYLLSGGLHIRKPAPAPLPARVEPLPDQHPAPNLAPIPVVAMRGRRRPDRTRST